MHECSKALPSAQDDFRSDCVERASKQGNDGCGPSGSCPEPRPQQAAMEYFAKAMAELLGCRSCYVAMLSASGLEEARIGDAPADPSCAAMVERFARKGTAEDVASLEPINSRTSFVRKLIGAEPPVKSHSVIGRFASDERTTVVFVAGWRPAALAASEIPGLAHTVRPLWKAAHSLARQAPGQVDAQLWLEELTFPAIVVDQGLHIYAVNRGGRVLLAKRELLRMEGGRLAGSCASVTESLRGAIGKVLIESGTHGWFNTTVPLSTDRQQFAFAKIGAVPTHDKLGQALIVVPQFDDVQGAHCIASAFGLNWAEEKNRRPDSSIPVPSRYWSRAWADRGNGANLHQEDHAQTGDQPTVGVLSSVSSHPIAFWRWQARELGEPAGLRRSIGRRGSDEIADGWQAFA